MDAIAAFAGMSRIPGSSGTAVNAAKTFILDTLGVGLAGSSGPKAQELAHAQSIWGSGDDARVWSTGERLPAPAVALCNAYQVHNAEFDCIHEAAVAHVMTVVLPVALAGAERMARIEGRPVDGRSDRGRCPRRRCRGLARASGDPDCVFPAGDRWRIWWLRGAGQAHGL
jgi:2-methylcitrate dehydratase PrpD